LAAIRRCLEAAFAMAEHLSVELPQDTHLTRRFAGSVPA